MSPALRYAILSGQANAARRPQLASPDIRSARLGDRTVIWGPAGRSLPLADAESRSTIVEGEAEELRLVIQTGRAFQDRFPDAHVVIDKGRHLIVALTSEAAAAQSAGHPCFTVRPLEPDTAVVATVRADARRLPPTPGVDSLVELVDRDAYESSLRHLAALPTRHSLSDAFQEAAAWAAGQLHDFGYQTTFEPIDVDAAKSTNVVGERTGEASGTRDLVVVTAHLDSINRAGQDAPAPGADDNASGAAGVIEIGRVLATWPSSHDVRLILFGGEEEGLHGSIQHVAALSAADQARLRAVINMDMVATKNSAALTVLLEGAPLSQHLIDRLAAAAAAHTSLTVETSLQPYNSDHVPFIDAGLPAVLTIEGTDTANGNVHTANDTLEHIHWDLALQIVRMNLAATAVLLDTH